jgi:hypothetical protein
MVDKSHKLGIKPKSGKLDSDVISPNTLREHDQFDLINAKKNYMD